MIPAVRLEQVTVAYGPTPVLHELSLEVPEHNFFIIIGPNSSGKTTLAKTIAGVLPCRQGRVEIFGRSLASYSRRSLARILAVVPQDVPRELPFTALEMVLLGRSPHLPLLGLEKKRDLEIAAEAMRLTDTWHLAHRRLHQLSGGERQRVIIAQALCQQPRLLLLDEPTAALDLAHQVRLMDLLEHLCREHGYTIIMISHDLNLAALYADSLALLKDGQVFRQGLPQEVLTYDQLEQVYGCVVVVQEHPVFRRPHVTLVPGRFLDGQGQWRNGPPGRPAGRD